MKFINKDSRRMFSVEEDIDPSEEHRCVITNEIAQDLIQKLLWSTGVNDDTLEDFMKRQLTFIVEEKKNE